MEWYTLAAKQGFAIAQHNLAVCYEKGQGVEKDINKAIEWYKKAAQQGFESAKERFDELTCKRLDGMDKIVGTETVEFNSSFSSDDVVPF